jgi:hypothetical protein
MKTLLPLLPLLSLLLLTSCASLYHFTIEVQEPAPITLPPRITNIGVLNNTVPQPGDKGITQTYQGTKIDHHPLNLDSIANITALSLSAHLQESAFFNHVWVFPTSIRTDNNWMGSQPLPQPLKTELFQTQHLNAIITIDRLLFKLDQEIRNNLYMKLTLHTIATSTLYIDERDTPLTSFSLADSITLSLPVLGDTTDILKHIPEALIADLAYTTGQQLSRHIIPTWTEKERILYTDPSARMSEALRFARSNNWSRAATLWTNQYTRATQPKAKAKIAANLAVAYEMQDQFPAALQWATTAQSHFQTPTTPIDDYLRELQKRLRDNDLLDLQWGLPINQD